MLSNCCLLNRIISLAEGVVDISDNLGGCDSIEEVENSISNCALNILYPRENDVYVAGNDIGIFFTLIPIVNELEIVYEYSIDNGATWINTEINEPLTTNDLNSQVYIEWNSIDEIVQSTNIQLRIQVNINENLTIEESEVFQIHPSNFYENDGFKDNGISEIDFPFSGIWGEITVFNINENSITHNCLDEFSRDYYDGLAWSSQSCDRPIFSPIDGEVIYINNSFDPICDELDDTVSGYGNQIVIQSSIDKTFAFRIAHLNSITDDLEIGSMVSLGEEIALTGGTSGQEFPHAHCSLYKNIYEWPEFFPSEVSQRPAPVIDLLKIGFGGALEGNITNTCNDFRDNFSAEYNFINGNINDIDNLGDYLILVVDDLLSFINNAYTSILGNLQIEIDNAEDLNELISLRVIDGDLIIRNTSLNSLEGLNNLAFVTGDLIIENNSNLMNFCALKNLFDINGIGGEIIITNNFYNPSSEEILSEEDCENTLTIDESILLEDLRLYPNPFKEELNIITSFAFDSIDIELFDINGRNINYKRDNSILDLSNISSGVYFLIVKISNSSRVIKIVKD